MITQVIAAHWMWAVLYPRYCSKAPDVSLPPDPLRWFALRRPGEELSWGHSACGCRAWPRIWASDSTFRITTGPQSSGPCQTTDQCNVSWNVAPHRSSCLSSDWSLIPQVLLSRGWLTSPLALPKSPPPRQDRCAVYLPSSQPRWPSVCNSTIHSVPTASLHGWRDRNFYHPIFLQAYQATATLSLESRKGQPLGVTTLKNIWRSDSSCEQTCLPLFLWVPKMNCGSWIIPEGADGSNHRTQLTPCWPQTHSFPPPELQAIAESSGPFLSWGVWQLLQESLYHLMSQDHCTCVEVLINIQLWVPDVIF